MAKIGNEAKLILTLAETKSELKITQVFKDNGNCDYYAGYRDAKNWVFAEIAQICMNLEQGK